MDVQVRVTSRFMSALFWGSGVVAIAFFVVHLVWLFTLPVEAAEPQFLGILPLLGNVCIGLCVIFAILTFSSVLFPWKPAGLFIGPEPRTLLVDYRDGTGQVALRPRTAAMHWSLSLWMITGAIQPAFIKFGNSDDRMAVLQFIQQ